MREEHYPKKYMRCDPSVWDKHMKRVDMMNISRNLYMKYLEILVLNHFDEFVDICMKKKKVKLNGESPPENEELRKVKKIEEEGDKKLLEKLNKINKTTYGKQKNGL